MKKQWFALVLVMALAAISVPAEAQVVVGSTHVAVGAPVYHGIPAAHGPVANGTVRHYNNGYVGVNARHGSRLPMTWGTGPVRATGPIVAGGGYVRGGVYGAGCSTAYIARRPFGGGFVTGGAVIHPVGGSTGYIAGGVSGPGWSVGGSIGW
jgi:hypothetical protein